MISIENLDTKSLLERLDKEKINKNKIDEMYRIKHTLFDISTIGYGV